MRRQNDLDSVFKTLRSRYLRLFIPVINDIFGKDYPLDTPVIALSESGVLSDGQTADGEEQVRERVTDSAIRVGDESYILECQSYADGSLVIRIIEYAFVSALRSAEQSPDRIRLEFPHFAVIYVKHVPSGPAEAEVVFALPDGQSMEYRVKGIHLEDLSREYILEHDLYAYVPFYITRYEKELRQEKGDTSQAEADLIYFRKELIQRCRDGRLTSAELTDLSNMSGKIISHFTDGNEAERRMKDIMGGKIIWDLPSDKMRWAREEGLAEGLAKGISEGVAEGLQKGLSQGAEQERLTSIRNLMDTLKLSAQEAMDALKISVQDQPRYLSML